MSDLRDTRDAVLKAPASRARSIRQVLVILLALYCGLLLMFAALQRSMIYQPVRTSRLAPPQPPAGGQVLPVECRTADGLTLHGWHWKPQQQAEDASPWVVLYLHGNGGNRSHRDGPCTLLTELGAEVLIFDYRGYGENAGQPTESGLARDAEAVWDYACHDLGCDPSQLILYGESLGGGVAVQLAHTHCQQNTPPAGLILRSTFDSLVETGAHHYPWLPVRWLLKDRYVSSDLISEIRVPLLSIHGMEDRIVPLERGRALYERAPAESSSGIPKRFVEIPDAGHNDLLLVAPAAIRAAIATFLESLPAPE